MRDLVEKLKVKCRHYLPTVLRKYPGIGKQGWGAGFKAILLTFLARESGG